MNKDHNYVARKRGCNCVVGLCIDDPKRPKRAAEAVQGFLKDGLVISRVSHDVYMNKIRHEETFLKCPHGEQAALFD